MSVKSNYFKMNKEEFDKYLNELKKSNNTIQLFNGKYFYNQTLDSINLAIELNKKMLELDSIINSFTNFAKNQIIQSFLIDEIESTNKIENIHSTRHDIFSIISKASLSKDKKIISISNAYKHLLESKGTVISSLFDIRKLYDIVLKDSIAKIDLPDGTYFRQNPVYISDGLKSIHTGIIGEDNINAAMEEFINLYNSKNEVFIKMILCHFMFENIHPFYDGNGRFGRFLFSNGLYLETKSFFSFIISSSLEHEKTKYYKAFKSANDKYEFGCLNEYVEIISTILLDQIKLLIQKLQYSKEIINNLKTPFKLTKSEEKIYKVICEASALSDFGVSNEEILNETGVSKRTLIYTLNKLKKEMNMIDTNIGKFSYHKFSINK